MNNYEFSPFIDDVEEEDYSVKFNRSRVYDSIVTRVNFWLGTFQNSPNGRKGLTELSRINFNFSVPSDDSDSEMVDDFQIKVEGFDGTSKIFELGEVEVEQLFWMGYLFMDIAKKKGIDMEQQRKVNEKEISS